MLQKLRGNKEGFTLIELMIVIAIIGILAAIAIPNFISYRDKAFCSRAEADAQNVMAALSSYFSEPENTALPSVTDLMNSEGLTLNEDNTAVLSEPSTDVYMVNVTDGSNRCPRGDSYTAYMGDDSLGGWE